MTEIWQMSATEIAQAVRAKRLSALEVTEAHLARLASVNPKINAVVQEMPEEARAAASALDQRIAAGEDPGLLAGVPVTIKVNVDQQGHATTNGLRLQETLVAEADSPVVSSLRKAGGIIVGRTNTPAFSLRWFTKNELHGQTLNPRDTSITPGGSSGGAGAAVAAGLCAVGHGTDIAGSVRYPAYACGLHGLRPTMGRVAAYNGTAADRHIGAQLMAVSGPLARTISDIRLSLAALAVEDPLDPWWMPAPLVGPDYPRRAALCVSPDGMPVCAEVEAALHDAADRLRAAGWQVEERDAPPMRPAALINETLWMAEMRAGAGDMVAKEGEADSMFIYKQMTDRAPEAGVPELLAALQARLGLIREWQFFLQDTPVLICPNSGQLPFKQQQDVNSEAAFADMMEAQLTQRALPVLGLPGLSVATGSVGSVPMGVQLIGRRYREDILLAAGEAIEAAGAPVTVADL